MSAETMTEAEAKAILTSYGYPNVRLHLLAIRTALAALGDDATMSDIWKWAEGKDIDGRNDNNTT